MDLSGHHNGRGRAASFEDIQAQEAGLRNIHISENNVAFSQGQSEEEMMGITMQDREAAEVLLQMGGMSRFANFGSVPGVGVPGPLRKSVITDTRSALQKETPIPGSLVSKPASISVPSATSASFMPGGSGGMVYISQPQKPQDISPLNLVRTQDQTQIAPRHKPDPQVPISVLKRTETLTSGDRFIRDFHRAEPQLLVGPSIPGSSSWKPRSVPEQQSLRTPKEACERIGGQVQASTPELSPSSATSSKNSKDSLSQRSSLFLPAPGPFISSAQISMSSSLPAPSSLSSSPALNLINLNNALTTKATITPILMSQTQMQPPSISNPSYATLSLLPRTFVPSNTPNDAQTTPLRSTWSRDPQILREKKQAIAAKKALRAEVALNTEPCKDVEVDGFIIPIEFWAKAFVQTDICHAAGILFKALFSTEEIQKCTLRGRNGTNLLNLQKRSAIFRAVGWMKQKDQNPYSFDSSANLDANHTLSHEEKMIIEKKVFVERRYQTSRKIRDHNNPRRRNKVTPPHIEALLSLVNNSNPGNTASSEPVDQNHPSQNLKVEEILVKPEPLDSDYYEGDYGAVGHDQVPPPTFMKKEPSDIDIDNKSQEMDTTSRPTSPKQLKLMKSTDHPNQ